MGDSITRCVQYLFVFPGPLLPAIAAFLLWRRRPRQARIFLGGVLSLVLFSCFVAVPYYFQGYADLGRPQAGKGLGWTRNPVIGFFAYWYTINLSGFLWLLMGMLLAAFGRASDKQWVNAVAKTATIFAFAWYLFNFHRFHSTINAVLE